MQGTISAFDPTTGTGALVTDIGERIDFPAEAFQRSGLRLLRPGQRVSVTVGDNGVVSLVTLVGFPEGGQAPPLG